MSNESQVYIHVGIHKTATTFLQRQVFPRLEGIKYINLRRECREFIEYVLYEDDIKFSAATALEKLRAKHDLSGKLVLSDEQFYGSPWDGCCLRHRHIRRLAAIFPSAEIIVVFRNQLDQIHSLYLQYLKMGGTVTWKEFLASKRHPLAFTVDYFHYGDYLLALSGIFGKSHYHVLFFEDFVADRSGFLKNLYAIIGAREPKEPIPLSRKENPSMPYYLAPFFLLMNMLFCSTANPNQLFHSLPRRAMFRILVPIMRVLPRGNRRFMKRDALDRFFAEKKPVARLRDYVDCRDLGYLDC